jgi:hypothetical protein
VTTDTKSMRDYMTIVYQAPKPTLLEYGIVKMPPEHVLDFWGHAFGN